jgi:hypothetical protein
VSLNILKQLDIPQTIMHYKLNVEMKENEIVACLVPPDMILTFLAFVWTRGRNHF